MFVGECPRQHSFRTARRSVGLDHHARLHRHRQGDAPPRLGRACPGLPVRTSGAGQVLAEAPEPAVVVATPGAEPVCPGGYGAALLLDGWAAAGRPRPARGRGGIAPLGQRGRAVRPGGTVVVGLMPACRPPGAGALGSGRVRRPRTRRAGRAGLPAGLPDGRHQRATGRGGRGVVGAQLPSGAQVVGPVPAEGETNACSCASRAATAPSWPARQGCGGRALGAALGRAGPHRAGPDRGGVNVRPAQAGDQRSPRWPPDTPPGPACLRGWRHDLPRNRPRRSRRARSPAAAAASAGPRARPSSLAARRSAWPTSTCRPTRGPRASSAHTRSSSTSPRESLAQAVRRRGRRRSAASTCW